MQLAEEERKRKEQQEEAAARERARVAAMEERKHTEEEARKRQQERQEQEEEEGRAQMSAALHNGIQQVRMWHAHACLVRVDLNQGIPPAVHKALGCRQDYCPTAICQPH